MQGSEAELVYNIEKHGIPNYIGGNTFLEMGFSHILEKSIFLYNPIPDLSYRDEMLAMQPRIINRDLTAII